jgi:hypothetical protein
MTLARSTRSKLRARMLEVVLVVVDELEEM